MTSLSLSPREAAIQAAVLASRSNLLSFTELTKPDFQAARHHELICSALEAVERGEISRLMVFLPPRHSKSELVSRRFPAWYLGRHPDRQFIAASYNSDLAMDFGRDVRNLVADPLYGRVFPGVSLRPDAKAADRWNTNQGGVYVSAGVGTGITGRGAHVAGIDDPHKDRREAASKTMRDRVYAWYRSTLYTRLMPGAAIVLTLTRWDEDDLAGRLLAEQADGGDQWTILRLPALAEGADLLGREDGEALWPDWYPVTTLQQIKTVVGNYEWNALYQQRPVAEEGNIFKRHWWRYYREVPAKFDWVIHSWDTAFKKGEDNDFSVCLVMGVAEKQIFLLDRVKRRMDYPELKRAAQGLAYRDKPHAILIEDKASGQSLLQDLRQDRSLSIIGIKPDRDKSARAAVVTPLIEGGRVLLPEWGDWTEDYADVLAAFPLGAHDDDVDATTQGLIYLKSKIDGKFEPKLLGPGRLVNRAQGWMVA